MTKRRFVLSTFVMTALLLHAVTARAQDNAADTAKLIDVLLLKPGSVVAEIGAGSGGELTIALAQHVGASGRVFSNELGNERVQRLRTAVEKSAVANVTIVDGHEQRANLPDGCCDAIFMRNVYHHFGDPAAMHASFLRALRPGGRIAIIDFTPRRFVRGDDSMPLTAPPGKRGDDSAHGVGPDVVAQELKAAGFDVVASEEGRDRWFIVVARR
ncbi:MAG TPA: methyltransferase domain-containing protein [Vicinamibacterales bacterium]|nr:methyltransferase domain-containing protein [Vicinamibacterales bacterium]